MVCDPFAGAGTTAYVAEKLGRRWLTGELNDCAPARQRLEDLANGLDINWRSPNKRIISHASHVCEPSDSLFADLGS